MKRLFGATRPLVHVACANFNRRLLTAPSESRLR